MNTLNEAMKKLLATQLPYVATVTNANTPDIGPKRSLRVYDDNTLIYNENTGGQTLTNINNGSKIAVTVIDWDALDGYRFLGSAKVYGEGTKEFQLAVEFAESKGWKPPKFAVLISIEDIFTMAPGPTAGKKL